MLSVFLLPVQAQDNCHSWTGAANFPPGWAVGNFGMPYNPYTNDITMQANCTDETVRATFGDGSPLTYIYDTVYIYVNNEWYPENINGEDGRMGNWVIGSGKTTFAEPTPELEDALINSTPVYLAAFICHWAADERLWKCGCDNEACEQHLWNIQEIVPTP